MFTLSGGAPAVKAGPQAPDDDGRPAPAPLYLAFCGPDYIDCGAYLPGFVELLLKERRGAEDLAVWMDDRPGGGAGYRLVALIREGAPGAGPTVTYF
ncbi:MAG TPA: hypothetical protein VFE78_18950 [Gemmataceae bacterium]|nr:hypothetical protein [Gemmataceae bacterium]